MAQAISRLSAPHHLLVVDCLTLWLTNLLMPADAGSAAVLAALRPVDWVVQADPIGCATLLLQVRPDALGCDAATAASLPAGLRSALLPGEGR